MFSKDNIKEVLPQISLQIQEKISQLKKLRIALIKLYKQLDSKWIELYEYYKTEYPIQLKDKEIQEFVRRNPEYLDLKEKVQTLETEIDVLEKEIKNLDNTRWDIKNFIEWTKLEMGVV